MNNEIILFHGSKDIIEQPVFGRGRKNNDYGLGFYCTESEEMAREWACTSLRDGFANRYCFDMTNLRVLDLNSEEYTILHWASVLISHRLFRPESPVAGKARQYLQENFAVNVEAYDLIRGYRADDAYYDFANAFLNNTVTVEQLSQAMRLGRLGEQIVLKSQYAFSKLKFEGYSMADREVFYPKRKMRNDQADAAFQSMAGEIDDGLYMIDIIREKVTADDPRIPRNISGKRDDQSRTGF